MLKFKNGFTEPIDTIDIFNIQDKDGFLMETNRKNRILGTIALIIVTVFWGGGFVGVDISLNYLAPMQVLCARFFIALILFFILSFKSLKTITKKEIKWGIVLGIALFLGFITQTIGLKYSTPSKNAFITALNVVIVPFIAYFTIKRPLSKIKLICAVISVAGVGILSINNDLTFGIGDILTLCCAFFFALQIFLTGEAIKTCRNSIMNFMQMSTAFVLSLIGSLIFEGTVKNIEMPGILGILYLGLISTGLCYVLQAAGQKYVDESRSAVILSMSAVFGTIFSIIIVGEILTTRMILGSIIILIAVIIAGISKDNIKSAKIDSP